MSTYGKLLYVMKIDELLRVISIYILKYSKLCIHLRRSNYIKKLLLIMYYILFFFF